MSKSGGGKKHVTGYVLIAQDVTVLKQAEEPRSDLLKKRIARAGVEAACERLRAPIDVLSQVMIITDTNGSRHRMRDRYP